MTRRVALITGGSSGIGLAVARQLLAEGCKVAIFGTNSEKLEKAKCELSGLGPLRTAQVDVRCADQIDSEMRAMAADFGSADILVNNVGGSTIRVTAYEMDVRTFDEILDLNLRTAFLCTRAVVPGMKERRWGRIVNVASVAGRTHALSTNSNAAYCAAKAGLIGFTKQCAAELAPFGIAVNAVAPGPIATERVVAGWSSRSDADREDMMSRIPAHRFGKPEEAAASICFLCSENAGYTAGTTIDVNGGLLM